MSSDGILLVDKPEGVSSARVVAIVKRRIQVKKVGHTGTLDPFATGLLPIAVGKGTRLSRFYLGGNKSYLATVKLGQTTDTYDNTGNVLQSASPETMAALDPEKIREEVARLMFTELLAHFKPAPDALWNLSHDRSRVVKTFLVETGGINASRIYLKQGNKEIAEGRGGVHMFLGVD